MMKTSRTTLIFALLLLTNLPFFLYSQEKQNQFWAISNDLVDFTGTSPTVSSLPHSGDPSNGMFTDNGNPIFYIENGTLYDNTHTYVDNFFPHAYATELGVVPVPGSCKENYYIIYYASNGVFLTDFAYRTYDVVNKVLGSEQVLETFSYSGAGIAIGTLRSNNTRFLYAVGFDELTRYTISSSGIGSAHIIGTALGTEAVEADLSPDGLTLAWAETGIDEYNVVQLDAAGDYVSNATYVIPNTSDVTGLEFLDDHSKLLVTSQGAGTNDGMNVIDLAMSPL